MLINMIYCKKVGDSLAQRRWGKMYKCEIYETTVPGKGTMYGIKCGKVKKLVSDNLENVKRISDKCNEYGGIDPIHLSDIIEDELWQG